MKAVVLHGGGPELDRFHQTILAELASSGWEAQGFVLRDLRIARCTGCFNCWTRTPGVCVIADEGRTVAERVARSGLVIYLSPVTFGGYSSNLKVAVDRLIPNILPFFTRINNEVHHQLRYDLQPLFLTIGFTEQPDTEGTKLFRKLTARNALNFHSSRQHSAIMSPTADSATIQAELRAFLQKGGGIQ